MVAQHYRWDFIGLSTDVKPTSANNEKVTDGSTFYCSDTSKLYVYCQGTWYERQPLGGGGGGGGEALVIETVSGATPTITGESSHIYICGEVTSLDFTPSATGLCEVIFTSGSTPTDLTIPDTVMMPDWFVMEANRTYEISVLEGTYGAVMSWS